MSAITEVAVSTVPGERMLADEQVKPVKKVRFILPAGNEAITFNHQEGVTEEVKTILLILVGLVSFLLFLYFVYRLVIITLEFLNSGSKTFEEQR